MNFMHSYALQLWIYQFLVVFFLVGGAATLAVGVGLIVGSDGTLRFLTAMNRWVSTRRVLSPVEESGASGQPAQKHRRWLAAALIAGAAFAIIGLGTRFDAGAVSHAFGLETRPSSVAPWLVESARWALIVGNLIAIVIGINLGFFPDQLAALEARGVRWYWNRRLAAGANDMNLSLDGWVAASPRAAGWIITVAGLVLVGDFAFALFGAR